MFTYIIHNLSLYYSNFPTMIFPFINSVKIYVHNSIVETTEFSSPLVKKKRPNLTIDTNIDENIVNYNYKKAISRSTEMANNVYYFRSYLKNFYSCEKTEEEIERILKTIQNIRKCVKNDFEALSVLYEKRISDILKSDEYFYKKNTTDFIVKLYKIDHFGNPAVVKTYIFYPKYLWTKYILEDRFETEIIFSMYAKKINEKCDFISPTVYAYGSVPILHEEDIEMRCLFIIMEYMEGISLKHAEFTPEVCTKIYEIKRKLSCELLSHNDLHPGNMMIDSSNNMVVLDYGESSFCI